MTNQDQWLIMARTVRVEEEWPNGRKDRMSATPTGKWEGGHAYNHNTLIPLVLHKEACKRCKLIMRYKNIHGVSLGTR